MRIKSIASFVVCAAIVGAWSPARADEDLAKILFTTTDVLLDPTNLFHQPHFAFDTSVDNLVLVEGINGAIGGQFATYPLGSSSGGFTYTFDAATGVGSRNSRTFGPQFAERALTIGKGKVNVGVQFLHAAYKELNGTDLKDGSLTVQFVHELDEFSTGRTDPNFYYQGDVIQNRMGIDLSLDTLLFVVNYGVTDRLDFGLGLPFVRAEIAVDSDQTILPLATGQDASPTHVFFGGGLTRSVHGEGSTSGVGDLVLRSKYNFLNPKKGSGFALALDLRVPTGDENNYLGTGVTQAKLYAVGSWTLGKIAPHFNAGYTQSIGTSTTAGDLPNEVNYVVGFEAECHPRITFLLDVVGRELLNALVPTQTTVGFQAYVPQTNTVTTTVLPQVVAEEKNQSLIDGTVGLKFNPAGQWLISIGVVVPISSDGLKSGPVGVIGFDYNF